MPQKSFTNLENKVTLYNRDGGSIWHARIKLKTGEWWRFSTKQTDFEEAKEVALKEYYTTDYKHKNNLPQNTRKFKSVANYSIKRMEDELAHGGGKTVCNDPALSAQVKPLMQMLQRVFSYPAPGVGGGCCKSRSSR